MRRARRRRRSRGNAAPRTGAERRDALAAVLVHEGGFAVAREDGALVFRRPDGSVIDAPHVAAAPLGHRVPAPRAPVAGPVDYHWAIGLVAPCKAA